MARNIVFLMTDQQRFDALGARNPLVKTPNLDSLAARGILFSEAVCNCPMCVPSRHSMMTGVYPSQLGVRHNMQMFPRDGDMPTPVRPFAQYFTDAGWATVCCGKTHWYIGEYDIPPEVSGVAPSKRGFETVYASGKRSAADKTDTIFINELGKPARSDKIVTQRGGEDVAGYVGRTSILTQDETPDGRMTAHAIEWLRSRDKTRPFFLYLSIHKPHAPLLVPAEYEAMYDINDIPDTPLPPPGWEEGMYEHTTPWRHRKAWAELDAETRRRTTLRYWALCTASDAMFGRLIDALEEEGLTGETDIIFTADHGDSLGERLRFSKYSLYEGSVRVPLIVAGPDVPPSLRGSVDARGAELVDILPTLLDMGGLKAPEWLPGDSLLKPPCRLGQFSEFHGSGYHDVQYGPKYMWREQGWKLVLNMPGKVPGALLRLDDAVGELYDLAADPLEINNLYSAPEQLARREAMQRRLLTHLMVCWAKFPRGMSTTQV